ncbi:MAG: STAS domain-containing protein [Lachnospiraceae bacterium]|nr:STAS domain-containing protein [Lachnospiraceae bacterium]
MDGEDLKILERVNPVFNTAKMCLYQLAMIGDKDAIAISEKLGLEKDETQNGTETAISENQLKVSLAMMETRYRTMEAMEKAAGCRTIVDLPCGYTPRGIQLAGSGMNYVGLDLPATILEAEPVVLSLIEENNRKNVTYAGVDATNYGSLEKVLKDKEGPFCITTEGLLMYFTESETGVLCDNIRRILEKKGGCWIVADPESALQYVLTARLFFGDEFLKMMASSSQRVKEKADVEIGKSSLIIHPGAETPESMKKAMEFLAKYGLKAERLTVSDYMPDLTGQSPETTENLKKAMESCAYWKITVIPDLPTKTEEYRSREVSVSARLAGDFLSMIFNGRIDTLSAPDVLRAFENIQEGNKIRRIEINCTGLEYISSAGLRVLLIMHKSAEDGLTLTGVKENVREILAQTGFESIFTVE